MKRKKKAPQGKLARTNGKVGDYLRGSKHDTHGCVAQLIKQIKCDLK